MTVIKKILYIPLLSLCIGCTTKQKETSDQSLNTYCIPNELEGQIGLYSIENQVIEKTISLTAEIHYNQETTVPYISLHDGIITQTYFSLGDYVQKGQILAEFKSASLSDLADQISTTGSQLEVAQRNLKATQEMFQDGISSEKELIEAKTDVAVLRSNLLALEDNMGFYRKGTTKTVFQIKAPSQGYIVDKQINTGMAFQAGDASLFTIANLDKVWVIANIYPSQASLVHPNQWVRIKSITSPESLLKGQVSYISPIFDSEQRVLKARIEMDNTQGLLKPGMSVEILLDLEQTQEQALAIPMQAVLFENNQNYVIVYHDSCNLEIRPVEAFDQNQAFMYVKKGFKAGDRVITTHELLLYEELNARDH